VREFVGTALPRVTDPRLTPTLGMNTSIKHVLLAMATASLGAAGCGHSTTQTASGAESSGSEMASSPEAGCGAVPEASDNTGEASCGADREAGTPAAANDAPSEASCGASDGTAAAPEAQSDDAHATPTAQPAQQPRRRAHRATPAPATTQAAAGSSEAACGEGTCA